MGDAGMAKLCQVTVGDKGCLVIVNDHGWQGTSRNSFAGNNHRRRGIGRSIGKRCRKTPVQQDHGVGLIAAQIGGIGCFAFGIVLRIADQDIIARLAGTFFDPGQNRRKERISDVRHQQKDHARTVQAQVSGHDIGGIAGRGDRSLHFFACGFGNHIRFVQGPADSGNRYPCMAGNIFNRRDFFTHASSYSAR